MRTVMTMAIFCLASLDIEAKIIETRHIEDVIPLIDDETWFLQEESEAIEEILSLTVQEIKQAFLQGYYTYNIRGVQKQIPFRDPFLAYALFMYELRQQNSVDAKSNIDELSSENERMKELIHLTKNEI